MAASWQTFSQSKCVVFHQSEKFEPFFNQLSSQCKDQEDDKLKMIMLKKSKLVYQIIHYYFVKKQTNFEI